MKATPTALARGLAVSRTLLGVALTLAPGLGRSWIGPDAGREGAQVMARGLGARDVAIGLGTLRALSREEPARPWLVGGMLADGADLAATLAAAGSLPLAGRALAVAMAGGSTTLGAWLASELE